MRLALALGGGGLKGAAHLGVLRVLADRGVKPDFVVGTSAGSIAAALYAVNSLPSPSLASFLPFHQMEEHLTTLRWLPMGLVEGAPVMAGLHQFLGARTFSQAERAAAAVAVDLHSGETVVFAANAPAGLANYGLVYGGDVPLKDAVRGSIAVPGIFTPHQVGERLLVDGGLTDNVPADVARAFGAERVIAVDLTPVVTATRPVKHVAEVLLQSLDIMGSRLTQQTLRQYANLVLRPVKQPVGALEFCAIPELISAGSAEVKQNWSAIERLL